MPGFPVLHQLPKLVQIHVHWVSDGIQPSRPPSSPSPLAFNLSQHQGLFQWVNSLSSVNTQRYYIIIDCIPHTVHFKAMSHLFCNWKFLPQSPTPVSHLPWPFLLCFFSISMTLFLFSYVCPFVLFKIPYITEIIWYLSFSVWFISLSIIASRSTHVVENDNIALFFMSEWYSIVCMCEYICTHTFSFAIHLLMGTEVVSTSWLL